MRSAQKSPNAVNFAATGALSQSLSPSGNPIRTMAPLSEGIKAKYPAVL